MILEWVAYPFSRVSSWPRDWTRVSCIAGRFFTNWAMKEYLRDIIDYSPSGSSLHGILQVRILELVAAPFSRVCSQPTDWTQVSHIASGFFTSWATREAQEYWSGWSKYWHGWSVPSPMDLPDPGIKPMSPALAGTFFTTEPPSKPLIWMNPMLSHEALKRRALCYVYVIIMK